VRILLLNLGTQSLEAVNAALAGQGYDIAAETGVTVDAVLARAPEVVITEATPSDLSCCGLIAQLKSRPGTESPIKIVMIVHGGALERARALEDACMAGGEARVLARLDDLSGSIRPILDGLEMWGVQQAASPMGLI